MASDLLKILNPEFGNCIIDPFRYTLLKKGPRGPYGICNFVHLASSDNKIIMTSRRFSKYPLTGEQIRYYIDEARFLMNLNHPFIVKYFGFTYKLPFTFFTQNTYYSTLYDAINSQTNKKDLTGTEKSTIALCIACSMIYLHTMNIVNYDLSSKNIFLYNNDYPKLGNFGLHPQIDYFPDDKEVKGVEINQWTPPELYDDGIPLPKTDVYSFGIILWELLTQQLPFPDVLLSEYETKIVKNEERPPIPAGTPKLLKKLIELCWSPNPEERPSYNKIYELFSTKKILFPNTDVNYIDKVSSVANEWMKEHGPKRKDFRNVGDVGSFLKTSSLKEIIEYTSSLDDTNCLPFFEGINKLTKEDTDERKFTVLFEILQLILLNKKCLEIYIQTGSVQNLPFLDDYYSEVCLSILIPVFSVAPNELTPQLFKILETLIPQFPIKILRLISVIINNKLDITMHKQLLDFLLTQSNSLIFNNATFPLVHTLYKLIRISPKLLESRGQYILRLFSTCLSSTTNECILATYNALIMLRPQLLPVEPDILCLHLQDHLIRPKTLQLLCFTRPVRISQKLVEILLQETKREKNAINSVLMLSRHNDFAQILLTKQNLWMEQNSINNETALKIVLVLMQQNSNKVYLVKSIINNKNLFPILLNSLIDKDKLDVIDALFSVVRNLPVDGEFVIGLSNSGFITNYLKMANDSNNDGVQLRGYYLVDFLGRIRFTPDYLVFLQRVKWDLSYNAKMKNFALNYCSIINLDQRGRQALIQNNMISMLSDIQKK